MESYGLVGRYMTKAKKHTKTRKLNKHPKKEQILYDNRRKAFLPAGLAVLCLAILYVVLSLQYWDKYTAYVKKYHLELYSQIDNQLSTTIRVDKDKQRLLRGFYNIRKNTQLIQKSCTPKGMFAWQAVFPSLSNRQANCNKLTTKLRSFGVEVDTVYSYLVSENNLGQQLRILTTLTDVSSEADFKRTQQTWAKVQQDVDELKVVSALEPLRKDISSASGLMARYWGELVIANQKQDKKAFEASVLAINNEYESFVTLQQTHQATTFVPMTQRLERAYQESF